MHSFLQFIFGIKLYMFRTVPLSIISSLELYTQQWYMSYRFADSLLASSQQTFMTYTVAVRTVLNCWWWTEELSETCRFLFQNKFEKLVHLIGFIIRTLVSTTHTEPVFLTITVAITIFASLTHLFCILEVYPDKFVTNFTFRPIFVIHSA